MDKTDLEKDIISDISGDFCKLMVALKRIEEQKIALS